ncbi:hypothetical protein L3V82_12560 [Thiotrichales bacterium 19S3-7]|nr:hypothetical protein [Thiotrichales bacterium 19S3-7]MCF6802776.1 hypothetical protein [Thiotrichales bacterium 19S3-11]
MFIKSILSNIASIMLVMAMIFGMLYINKKLNHINNLWLDANQVVIDNQQHQIRINQAYSNQLDRFTTVISQLKPNEHSNWLKPYQPEIQSLLKTPPEGLHPQDGR